MKTSTGESVLLVIRLTSCTDEPVLVFTARSVPFIPFIASSEARQWLKGWLQELALSCWLESRQAGVGHSSHDGLRPCPHQNSKGPNWSVHPAPVSHIGGILAQMGALLQVTASGPIGEGAWCGVEGTCSARTLPTVRRNC